VAPEKRHVGEIDKMASRRHDRGVEIPAAENLVGAVLNPGVPFLVWKCVTEIKNSCDH
jgi:hypothetical protein